MQLAKLNALSSRLMIARSKEDVKEITDIIKETKRFSSQQGFLSNKSKSKTFYKN